MPDDRDNLPKQRTTPQTALPHNDTPAWRWLLLVWMAVIAISNGIVWTTGVRDYDLAQAVEEGTARVEDRMEGEESEDVVRKEIQLQRDTLPFWTILAAITDFLVAPLSIGLRALVVAIAFSALAAVSGRPARFPVTLAQCVAWQGIWVLGVVLPALLMLVLRQPHIETSVLVFLPADSYTASHWVALQQVDCFALIGWVCLACSAWRRRQANLVVALLVCATVAVVEAAIVASSSLLVNLSIRLTIFPE